jgi:NTE family protein
LFTRGDHSDQEIANNYVEGRDAPKIGNSMTTTASVPAKDAFRGPYTQTALVFQGGGALGAYQAGVYQALAEAGCTPDWLSGISIGAINAAIIAGNEPDMRLPRLRQFWEQSTSSFRWPALDFGDDMRRAFNYTSAMSALLSGQPGFFKPRFVPPLLQPHGAAGALSVYDTSPLRTTLETLVDFDCINAGKTRLSLGAVNIRLGNFVYFDSTECKITPDHVMASAALPPGFPPIEIEGESYWDGGLVSNTPLVHVLDTGLIHDTLVFQVDLFSARGAMPGDLIEAEERKKHIVYSSRTRLNTDHFREKHALRQAIVELFEELPPEAKQNEKIRKLRDLGDDHAVAIVHLIYRRASYEGQATDYEFSRVSMREHWQTGLDDGRRTLRRPLWLQRWEGVGGVRVFDLAQDSESP